MEGVGADADGYLVGKLLVKVTGVHVTFLDMRHVLGLDCLGIQSVIWNEQVSLSSSIKGGCNNNNDFVGTDPSRGTQKTAAS